MKIFCISSTAHPNCIGGIETFERNLKNMFMKELKIFAFKTDKNKYFKVSDIFEIDKKELKFKILRKIFGLNIIMKNILNKVDYDICIINNPKKELNWIKKNSKKILVQHECYDSYIKNFFENDKKIVKKIKKKLDYFIFLSDYDKERFIKEIDFPREKSVVIRHTCEIELLNNSKERNKELIMICRLENKHKRIDLAINAMKKLKNYTLNIYGDGEDKQYLENLIKENNLKNVFLHGGTNQVKERLDENSIFIMTSDYEGYPITTIEAMRRGLPIILRNTFDSASDIIQNNGILLDKEWNEDEFIEAVNKVYNNYEYYSINSIEKGKRYNFETIKKDWNDLFNKLKKI